MHEQLCRFTHHDIEGAVIRVMDDENLSLNEFLPENHRLEFGDEFEFAYTCAYLAYRGQHVLIDAGFDPDTTPGALEILDIAPEDIDWVLLTHADRDHVAGLLMHDGSLTYPRAQHVIGKTLWDHLYSPTTLNGLDEERGSFYRKLHKALDETIRLCDGETTVADGIRFIPSPGHRIGHGIYEFESAATPLLHSGDSYFHPLFAEHPDWPNLFDSLPEEGVNSRKLLSPRVSQSQALILSSHAPFPGIGRLQVIDDETYRWVPESCDE